VTENKILFDWLTYTIISNDWTPDDVIEFLGLSSYDWQGLNGMHGYRDRKYLDGISVMYNGREDMGVCVEMSGSGVRFFEEHGRGEIMNIIQFITENQSICNLTRLDIAYDDFDGLLDFGVICADIRAYNWVSRFKKISIEEEFSKNPLNGLTVYCGSKKSDIMFRIYDKRAERGREDLNHWVRFEIQLRDDRAKAFADMLYCGVVINELFKGVVLNYLRFVEPSETDTNISRAKMKDYWQKFIENVDMVRLTKEGTEYNASRLADFVVKQTISAAVTFVELFGMDMYYDLLRLRSSGNMNKKYIELLKKYGLNGGDAFCGAT